MTEFVTEFGYLDNYEKGHIEIINDSPKTYVFSNVFEVASNATPYEKVLVAVNLEYAIEAIRAEGTSCWMTASHDEFCVVMDGKVIVELVKLDDPSAAAPDTTVGTVKIEGEPKGARMGTIELGHGHQALLPKGSAYRFIAANPSVMIQQTLVGEMSVEKWAEICYS